MASSIARLIGFGLARQTLRAEPLLIADAITHRYSTTRIALLMIEQPFLAPQTAPISAEGPVGSNDAVTRDDDANHVRAIRATNCATRIFVAQSFCHPRIGTRFAKWN